MKSFHQPLSDPDLLSLVRRMELEPKLLRRHLEEQITALVPLEEAWLEESRSNFLNDRPLDQFLQEKGWTSDDLELHLRRLKRCVDLPINVSPQVLKSVSLLPRAPVIS